jgi:hypothetical protein
MAKPKKVTFTLDAQTVDRIARTAARLRLPKSGVVREAVAEYAAKAGQMSERERLRMLAAFDTVMARIPVRPAATADKEIAEIRRSRRAAGKRRGRE